VKGYNQKKSNYVEKSKKYYFLLIQNRFRECSLKTVT
jgi:hypothetical protein